MNEMKPVPVVLERGWCTCTAAPMGHAGLEGYMDNMDYQYERVMNPGVPSEQWYRVYHHKSADDEDNYYETCGNNVFKMHFKIFRIDTTL
jgi:hypothetical protein